MVKTAAKSQLYATINWFFYALTTVLLAVFICWGLYSKADYGYPFWFRHMHIDQHIQQYAPQNPYKHGFAQLPT
ncbi:MAG: DUF1461 domain-containing protein, partial [Alcanivorax sp.]|nr:DUF1461 domain-containing protein [Alcanivorax sp.]